MRPGRAKPSFARAETLLRLGRTARQEGGPGPTAKSGFAAGCQRTGAYRSHHPGAASPGGVRGHTRRGIRGHTANELVVRCVSQSPEAVTCVSPSRPCLCMAVCPHGRVSPWPRIVCVPVAEGCVSPPACVSPWRKGVCPLTPGPTCTPAQLGVEFSFFSASVLHA